MVTVARVLTIFSCLGLLSGCGKPNVRPFAPIANVEDFCLHGAAKGPGMLSVMGSLGDTMPAANPMTTDQIREKVHVAGGAIAHWRDLNVLLPTVAKTLGDADGYVHVQAAAFTNPPETAANRIVALLVNVNGQSRWYNFTAFDVQNLCIEGAPKS